MVSYSDSIEYCSKEDLSANVILTFVAGFVKDGVTAKTYSTRAEIMVIFKNNLNL